MGIDVGFRRCGYVLCDIENSEINLIKEEELIPARYPELTQKLHYIFTSLGREVETFKPQAILVEKLYSHYRHPTTLGLLAQVRGVVALLAAQRNLDFLEFSTTRVRKAFLGRGNVNSFQVKRMAENIARRVFKSTHTADAFSLVVAFSHLQKFKRLKCF